MALGSLYAPKTSLLAARCRHQHAESLRSLNRLKSPPLMPTSSRTGHSAKRTELTEPGNRARPLGVASFGALLCELGGRDRKAGGVTSHLQMTSLFERIGGERPIQSDSNG